MGFLVRCSKGCRITALNDIKIPYEIFVSDGEDKIKYCKLCGSEIYRPKIKEEGYYYD